MARGTKNSSATQDVTTELVSLEMMEHAAECLKTIAHPHRLRMIEMCLDAECTVGELAEGCGISSAQTSGHLRLLKDRGLLYARREGRNIYYGLAEDGMRGIMSCIRGRFGSE